MNRCKNLETMMCTYPNCPCFAMSPNRNETTETAKLFMDRQNDRELFEKLLHADSNHRCEVRLTPHYRKQINKLI